jgi:hypothetical protein
MFEYLGVAPPADPEEAEVAPALAGDEGAASPEPSCPAVEDLTLPEPVAAVAPESARAPVVQNMVLQNPVAQNMVPQDVVLEDQDEDQDEDRWPLESALTMTETEAEQEEEAEGSPSPNRNVVQDTLVKLLNQRVYSDDPPLKITAEDVAQIPGLSSTQKAADFIEAIDDNIDLINMRADAARRARKLEDLQKANGAKRCRHVKFSGDDCGSPALRGQEYCYFHAQTHAGCVDIPVIEDQRSLQVAFARLASQVASNKIDAAHARVLLQILESAGGALPAEADAIA